MFLKSGMGQHQNRISVSSCDPSEVSVRLTVRSGNTCGEEGWKPRPRHCRENSTCYFSRKKDLSLFVVFLKKFFERIYHI